MQIRRAIALIFAFVICFTATIFAEAPIDYEERGSIIVLMEYNDEPVGGGTMALFHVATPVWKEDRYVFEYTQAFSGCKISLDEPSAQKTANALVEYAIDHEMLGKEGRIDEDGQVKFQNLKVGLYLLVQEEAADGYFAAEPFLISVPMYSGEKWVYDVDATPKVDIEREPQPTLPEPPDDIPQTGQLKWPIPVLIVSGLAFFVLGWALCFRRKKNQSEEE